MRIQTSDFGGDHRQHNLSAIRAMDRVKKRFLLYLFCSVFACSAYGQNSPQVARPTNPGKLVYEQNCPGCHGWDARGELNVAPPLIKGTFVGGDKQRLIRLMLEGLEEVEIKGQYYPSPMPSFNYLSDLEIADVLTFVRSNFSNNASAITAAEVAEVRKEVTKVKKKE